MKKEHNSHAKNLYINAIFDTICAAIFDVIDFFVILTDLLNFLGGFWLAYLRKINEPCNNHKNQLQRLRF